MPKGIYGTKGNRSASEQSFELIFHPNDDGQRTGGQDPAARKARGKAQPKDYERCDVVE